MDDSKDIAVKENQIVTDNQISTYLESLGCTLKPAQRTQFIEIAKGFNLNPFKREIYGIGYGTSFNIIIGYEVYLKRAEYSCKLSGWRCWVEGDLTFISKEVSYKDNQGNWKKKTIKAPRGLKGCIEIYRKDWDKPFYHEVQIEEYTADNAIWCSKARTMIKKVAIAQGFRMCFPVDLGGLPYIAEEILQEKDITPEKPQETPKSEKLENAVDRLIKKLKQKKIDVKEFAKFAGIKSDDLVGCETTLNDFDNLVKEYKNCSEMVS